MASVVVIPQNYEDLPSVERRQIIPICITACDGLGQPIAVEWFVSGVAPIRKELVGLAHHALGDPWRVSELAEITVHRLWKRHGSAVGRYPSRRVLVKAKWIAEELKTGDWRRMKYPKLYLTLDALDEKIREQIVADPRESAERFEQQIMLNSIEARLQREGRTLIRTMFQLIRRGYSWQEVAERVDLPSGEIAKRRFYRWIKKIDAA
jgi:DNA-directed RNA polymerase specialized sigma24 family protein